MTEQDEMRERLLDFLAERQKAALPYFTSNDAYAAMRIAVNDLTEPMREQIGVWIEGAGWYRTSKRIGPKTRRVWAHGEGETIGETGVFDVKSRSKASSYFELTAILAPSNSPSEMPSIVEYAASKAIDALLQIVESPQRRAKSQLAVVLAAKALMSEDGLRSQRMVQRLLDHRAQQALTRLAERATPQPAAGPRPPRRFPVGDAAADGDQS
jgi:hypothetical protein